MTLFGTIVNGQVQLDHPAALPNGSRVMLSPSTEDDDDFG